MRANERAKKQDSPLWEFRSAASLLKTANALEFTSAKALFDEAVEKYPERLAANDHRTYLELSKDREESQAQITGDLVD